jgi:hypothetical protein
MYGTVVMLLCLQVWSLTIRVSARLAKVEAGTHVLDANTPWAGFLSCQIDRIIPGLRRRAQSPDSSHQPAYPKCPHHLLEKNSLASQFFFLLLLTRITPQWPVMISLQRLGCLPNELLPCRQQVILLYSILVSQLLCHTCITESK